MARKRKAVVREILPDPKYGNVKVSKFMNCVMRSGKKSVAEGIVYGAFDVIGEKTQKDPLEVFLQAIDNIRPMVKVVSKRVGGQNYQVPLEVSEKNGQAIAFRWLIGYAKNRSEKSMVERLAAEIMAAYNKEGSSIKKREDTHKMAEANKAFAHLRW
ncbi:MAG: 30S ribosomal protein S7 [Candidatus Cloacimonas sp.]|jgi:small subunit ribosomal protein S7|nr:30S ribosomal protein S7 [Candidatus Cloacimonadota bacterium]